MKTELTKHNIAEVKVVLEGIEGKSVMLNGTTLYGVKSINIFEDEMFYGDPIPEEGYDGGKTQLILLTFNFESGKAERSFCPDSEHCEISFETENLLAFRIQDLKEYIENEKFDLDFRLKEYEAYMSR